MMRCLSFSGKNDAESSINFVKILCLDPKCAKLNQNSDFGHVRTCQDLSRRTSTYCKPAEMFLFFFRNCTFPFLLTNLSSFIKSCVLLNKFIIFSDCTSGPVSTYVQPLNIRWAAKQKHATQQIWEGLTEKLFLLRMCVFLCDLMFSCMFSLFDAWSAILYLIIVEILDFQLLPLGKHS